MLLGGRSIRIIESSSEGLEYQQGRLGEDNGRYKEDDSDEGSAMSRYRNLMVSENYFTMSEAESLAKQTIPSDGFPRTSIKL